MAPHTIKTLDIKNLSFMLITENISSDNEQKEKNT